MMIDRQLKMATTLHSPERPARFGRRSRFAASALLAGGLFVGTAGAQEAVAAESFALRAKVVHVGDGTTIEGGVVTIENGKIKSVGTDVPNGVRVVDVDGHLSPGLIALRDTTGAGSENNESTRKVTPTADVARAFDPTHPAWAYLLHEGITTVVLTPSSSSIIGGTAAIVSPASGEVVKRGALMTLGASSRSISTSVEPTSYAGLYSHLRDAFAGAKADSALSKVKAGSMPVLIEAISRHEVVQAVSFAKEMGLKGAILGAPRAVDAIEMLKDAGLAVVFEPVAVGQTRFAALSALALEKAKLPFAFTSDSSSDGAASMRMTAAWFMRAGLDGKTAMAAMTKNAADIAGVGASHGTIAAGKVADLVVWSGSPTELTSRVMRVYGGGKLVHEPSMNSASSVTGAKR